MAATSSPKAKKLDSTGESQEESGEHHHHHHHQQQQQSQQQQQQQQQQWNIVKYFETLLPSSLKTPPPPTTSTTGGEPQRRRGTLEADTVNLSSTLSKSNNTLTVDDNGESRWRRSRSMPSTPKRGQKSQQQQQQQQQRTNNNMDTLSVSPTPPTNVKKTSLPREWKPENGPRKASSFITFEEGEQVKAALLLEAARIKEKLRRTYSANVSVKRRRERIQKQQQEFLNRTSAAGESRVRYHSVEDDRLTGRKELLRQQDSLPNTTTTAAATSSISSGPAWASIAQQKQKQHTELVIGRSNRNFRRSGGSGSGNGSGSGGIRGPFVRAPTDEVENRSNSRSRSPSPRNHPLHRSPLATAAMTTTTTTAVVSNHHNNNNKQKEEKSRKESDSSNSSTEAAALNLGVDSKALLSPFTSPCPSPLPGQQQQQPPALPQQQQQQKLRSPVGESESPGRLSPYTSPCTSPYMRRRRAEYRASSTGSATANVASSSYGSNASRGSFSLCGGPNAPPSSPGSNLLSPYSVSPSPSNPASPTSQSHQNSLASRRLSSCRPSFSSCSSVFSFSSSKENSPDVLAATQQHPVPMLPSPRSPFGPPPDFRHMQVQQQNSLGSGGSSAGSGSAFVYPPPPQPQPHPGSSAGSRGSLHRSRRPEDHVAVVNPELYRETSVETGLNDEISECQVRFRLSYAEEHDWLEVTVVKIKAVPKNLQEVTIRLTLQPDDKRAILATFPVKEGQRDIIVNKEFLFPTQKSELTHRALKIVLKGQVRSPQNNTPGQHQQQQQRRQSFSIGEFAKPLKIVNFESNEELVFTEVMNQSEAAAMVDVSSLLPNPPRVKICLNFNGELGRLTVTVYDVERLDSWSEAGKCYAKVSLLHHRLKTLKSKRTDAVRVDKQMAFNEAFNFKVEEKAIVEDVGVKIELVEAASLLGRDKSVGQVILGGNMMAKGSGEEHWRKILYVQKNSIQMWHELSMMNKAEEQSC